jgi:hypothetical protein
MSPGRRFGGAGPTSQEATSVLALHAFRNIEERLMFHRILLACLVITFFLPLAAQAERRRPFFAPMVLAGSPPPTTPTDATAPAAGKRQSPPNQPDPTSIPAPPVPEEKPVGVEVSYKLHYDYWRNNLKTSEDGAVWTHALNISFRVNPLNLTVNFSTNYLNILHKTVGREIYFGSWTDSTLSFNWEQNVFKLFSVDWRLGLGLELNIPTGGTRLGNNQAQAIPNSSVVTADNKGSGFNVGTSATITTEPIPNFLTTSVSGRFVYTGPYQPTSSGDPNMDQEVDETYSLCGQLSLSLVPCSTLNISTSGSYTLSWQRGQIIHSVGANASADLTLGKVSINFGAGYNWAQTDEWTPYLKKLLDFQTGHTVSVSGGIGYTILSNMTLAFRFNYSYNWDGRTMDPHHINVGHSATLGPELNWNFHQRFRLDMHFKWAKSVGLQEDSYTRRTVQDTSDFDGFQFMIGITFLW